MRSKGSRENQLWTKWLVNMRFTHWLPVNSSRQNLKLAVWCASDGSHVTQRLWPVSRSGRHINGVLAFTSALEADLSVLQWDLWSAAQSRAVTSPSACFPNTQSPKVGNSFCWLGGSQKCWTWPKLHIKHKFYWWNSDTTPSDLFKQSALIQISYMVLKSSRGLVLSCWRPQ